MKPDNYWQQCYRYWGGRFMNPKWYDTLWIVPAAALVMTYSILYTLAINIWRK